MLNAVGTNDFVDRYQLKVQELCAKLISTNGQSYCNYRLEYKRSTSDSIFSKLKRKKGEGHKILPRKIGVNCIVQCHCIWGTFYAKAC